MIELFEGLPGAGKTHEVVRMRLLDILKHTQRACRVRVNGVEVRKWSILLGIPEAELQGRLIVLEEADVPRLPQTSQLGDFIVIDEAQSFWRSGEKIDPEILKWLETHRHKGQDIVLMAQRWDQLAQGVSRLVEITTHYRKGTRFGIWSRFQGFIRGNPREKEVIRSYVGRYDPKVYPFYDSYNAKGIQEVPAFVGSIFRSPLLVGGLLFAVIGLAWFWRTPGLEQYAQTAMVTERPEGTRLPASGETWPGSGRKKPAVIPVGSASASRSLVIIGSLGYEDGTGWRFLLDDGRMLTLQEAQGLAAGPTIWRESGPGQWKLEGEGVRYGTPVGSDLDPANRPSGGGLLPPGLNGGPYPAAAPAGGVTP